MKSWTEILQRAALESHPQQVVINNLRDLFSRGVGFTAASLGKTLEIKPASLGLSLLDVSKLANEILKARAMFFDSLTIPTTITDKLGNVWKVGFMCPVCEQADCDNADLVAFPTTNIKGKK